MYIHTCTHWSLRFNILDSDFRLTWVYSQLYHLLSMLLQLIYILNLSETLTSFEKQRGTMNILNKLKVLLFNYCFCWQDAFRKISSCDISKYSWFILCIWKVYFQSSSDRNILLEDHS